jgi:uncharacterized protein YaaN involved in tellurite resistance
MFDRTRRFLSRYDSLAKQIDKITVELETGQRQLLKDILLLDNLYERNKNFAQTLELLVVAGSLRVKEYNEDVLPVLKEKADASDDPEDAQHYANVSKLVNNFEKRLHDLKLTRMIAFQTAPQIKMIQANDQVLAEKLNTAINNTIPLWKQQVVLAITLMRQGEALKAQKAVSETTKRLLEENSKRLKTQAVTIAKENEKGLVSIDTLKQVNADLISTLDQTLEIQQEGRRARALVERELIQLEGSLKQRLKKARA